ncbi:hypothetical protein GDV60_15430 [Pseudomonas sp. DTU12.1]|nr:hypothetical protein GDV60_15430 [Pseudomonas sp. DTU12.1]
MPAKAAGQPTSLAAPTPSQHEYLHNSLFWGCVHIRYCGHGGYGFRPDGGLLWTGPALRLFKSEPPSGRNP